MEKDIRPMAGQCWWSWNPARTEGGAGSEPAAYFKPMRMVQFFLGYSGGVRHLGAAAVKHNTIPNCTGHFFRLGAL